MRGEKWKLVTRCDSTGSTHVIIGDGHGPPPIDLHLWSGEGDGWKVGVEGIVAQ